MHHRLPPSCAASLRTPSYRVPLHQRPTYPAECHPLTPAAAPTDRAENYSSHFFPVDRFYSLARLPVNIWQESYLTSARTAGLPTCNCTSYCHLQRAAPLPPEEELGDPARRVGDEVEPWRCRGHLAEGGTATTRLQQYPISRECNMQHAIAIRSRRVRGRSEGTASRYPKPVCNLPVVLFIYRLFSVALRKARDAVP